MEYYKEGLTIESKIIFKTIFKWILNPPADPIKFGV